MRNPETLNVIFLSILILTLTFIHSAEAQEQAENMQTFFSRECPGISIKVNATRETIPGENITINLWINCTADGVSVDYLYLSVYGFVTGQEKILLNVTYTMKGISLVFNHVIEYNYTVHIPNDVWGATHAELRFKYAIKDLSFPEYNTGFSMTHMRNVYLEELENQLKNLNESYQQLNDTYWQLNSSYEQLNETYWDLKGTIGGPDTTRNAAIVLAITTTCLTATTTYLMIRKPKQSS